MNAMSVGAQSPRGGPRGIGRTVSLIAALLYLVSVSPIRANQQCPSSVKVPQEDLVIGQTLGRLSGISAAKFAEGLIGGGNTYDIVSDSSGWMLSGTGPDDVPLIVHPTTVTSANPFSFGLSWPLLECVMQNNVAVLLSDGAYNHLTFLWGKEGKSGRYAIIDANPDDFFLAGRRNLLGISAERRQIKSGRIVHWLTGADFRAVFKEALYSTSAQTFLALYDAAGSDAQRAELAYAAFLTFSVYGDDWNIGTSLKMARKVIDKLDDLEPARKSRFPNELRVTLAIAELMNSRRKSYDMLPKGVGTNSSAFVFNAIFPGPLEFDRELIAALRQKLDSVSPIAPSNMSSIKAIDPGPRKVERLLLHRLLKATVLYGGADEAAALLIAAKESYPDDPKIVMYSAVLALKMAETSDVLQHLESAVDEVERSMMKVAKVTNLNAFRQAMADYHVEEDPASVQFDAWQAVVVMARKSAEARGQKQMAARFAEKEFFGLYSANTGSLCRDMSEYAQYQKSSSLAAAASRVRAVGWFGVTCAKKSRH